MSCDIFILLFEKSYADGAVHLKISLVLPYLPIQKRQKKKKKIWRTFADIVKESTSSNFQRKINPTWVEILRNFHFINKWPGFCQTISLRSKVYVVSFITKLVLPNDRKLYTLIEKLLKPVAILNFIPVFCLDREPQGRDPNWNKIYIDLFKMSSIIFILLVFINTFICSSVLLHFSIYKKFDKNLIILNYLRFQFNKNIIHLYQCWQNIIDLSFCWQNIIDVLFCWGYLYHLD